MPILDFQQFGGKNWETVAMKNTLAHAGVAAPHTGQPFSEALCFGIAGGIAAGYSFCPSIPGYDIGSGVSIVGRYHHFSTDGEFIRGFFERIGARLQVQETSGVKGAYRHLVQALEGGRPGIVWSSPLPVAPAVWAGCGGMYTTVVFGVDEAKGIAYISDMAPGPLTLPLDQLEAARNKVCSHRNRLLTFDAPSKLNGARLKSAVIEGIRLCAADFQKPRLKTYNLPGFLDWSKVIANETNARGWLRIFPDGRIYMALRDTFDSIETAGTGGAGYRPMYAEFLDEAAAVAKRKAFAELAARYRELAKQWTALAESMLPNSVKPFRRTKELLRKRGDLFLSKGAGALPRIEKVKDELTRIELEMREGFPLAEAELKDFLEAARERIVALHAAESAAANELAKAAA
jgi:hypothetical protein